MSFIDDLLDKSKTCANIDSDYRLAKVIGITHAAISSYRMGKSLPNESVIEQLCALSGDDPGLIAAQIQALRSKSPEAKSLWLKVAARMAGGASTAILSVLFLLGVIASVPGSARAGELGSTNPSAFQLVIHRMKYEIVSMHYFLLVRLRQMSGLLRLCILTVS